MPPRIYRSAPSAAWFMARAIAAPWRAGLGEAPPALCTAWRGHAVAGAPLERFLTLTGMPEHGAWPLLYPQAAGFRLQMALLTERAFPLPIWGALQIRNRLVLHRAFGRGAVLDLEVRPNAQRILDRGAELDLTMNVSHGEEPVWEGVTTFYYRGRFGAAQPPAPLTAAPEVQGTEAARWRTDAGGGARFGTVTGDYNGIHLSDWYARRFGFRSAFLHPQRVLGQCLARLPELAHPPPLRLDAWLKGPVHYGAQVRLLADAAAGTFALLVEDEERPAIVGRAR